MNQSPEAAYKALREASNNIAVVDTHSTCRGSGPANRTCLQSCSATTENDVFASG